MSFPHRTSHEWSRRDATTPYTVSVFNKPPVLNRGAIAPLGNAFGQKFSIVQGTMMSQSTALPAFAPRSAVTPPSKAVLLPSMALAPQTLGVVPTRTQRLGSSTFEPLPMVKKTTLKVGHGKPCAVGDMVDVTYVGWLAGDDPSSPSGRFDEGAHFQFVLGAGEVIPGWDLTFVGMLEGERARLVVPPLLAYGARGMPPKVPPNTELHFEVHINTVARPASAASNPPAPAAAPPAAAAAAGLHPFSQDRLRELIPSPPKAARTKPAMPSTPAPDAAAPQFNPLGSYTNGRAPVLQPRVGMPVPGTAPLSHLPPPTATALTTRASSAAAAKVAATPAHTKAAAATPGAPAAPERHRPALPGVPAERPEPERVQTASKSVRFDESVLLPPPTAEATDPRRYYERALAEILQRKMSEQLGVFQPSVFQPPTALQQQFPNGVPGQGNFMRRGFKHL